jgi:hypothetical protein
MVQHAIILVLSLVCLCGFAQDRRAAFFAPQATVAAVFSPTNIAGVESMAWWVADNITASDMSTDGKNNHTNWPDAGPYGYTITNRIVGSSKWPTNVIAGVNSHNYSRSAQAFSSGGLTALLFTNRNAITEIVMAGRIWQPPTASTVIFDSFSSGNRQVVRYDASTPAKVQLITTPGGGAAGSQLTTTNKWMVFDFLFNGANSGWLTNNISASGLVSPGTDKMDGITVGANFLLSGVASMDFAEICVYTNTLGVVPSAGTYSTAINRSNLFVYLTNKYNISP